MQIKFFSYTFLILLFISGSISANYAATKSGPTFPIITRVSEWLSPNRTVTLKEGEPVYLELMNDYDASKLEVGNTVQFRVTTNVIVDKREVIRAFSTAIGVVSRKEDATTNTNGKVQFTVRHVRAVDGQQVLVDGPSNLMMPTIGTQVTVYVKNEVDVKVN
jgi:hypothetical protein